MPIYILLTYSPEQDTLIQTLAEQNATRNQQFQLLLIAIPILSTIPYLLALFHASTFLIGVLGLSSLFSTVYLLSTLPPIDTGIPVLDKWARSRPGSSSAEDEGSSAVAPGSSSTRDGFTRRASDGSRRRQRTSSFSFTEQKSPLELYLPYLNLGLCGVLVLYGLLVRGGSEGHRFGWLGLGNIPAIVYSVVIISKMVMASVDPERELGGLRYEYKGA